MQFKYSQPIIGGTPTMLMSHGGSTYQGNADLLPSYWPKYAFGFINGKMFDIPYNVYPDGDKVIDWLPANAKIYKSIENKGGICWIAKDDKFIYFLGPNCQPVVEKQSLDPKYDYLIDSIKSHYGQPNGQPASADCVGNMVLSNGNTYIVPRELQVDQPSGSVLGAIAWDGHLYGWTRKGVWCVDTNQIVYNHPPESFVHTDGKIYQTMVTKFIDGYVFISSIGPNSEYYPIDDFYKGVPGYTLGTKYRIKITKKVKKVGRECCVCLNYTPRMMAYSCGHLVVCVDCDRQIASADNKCPVCRQVIASRMPVFLS